MWSITSPDGQTLMFADLSVRIEQSYATAAVPPAQPEGSALPAPLLRLHLRSQQRSTHLPDLRRRLLALLNPARSQHTPALLHYGTGAAQITLPVQYAGGLDDPPDPPDSMALVLRLLPSDTAWTATSSATAVAGWTASDSSITSDTAWTATSSATATLAGHVTLPAADYLLEQAGIGGWRIPADLDGPVQAVLVLPDGSAVIGGEFSGSVCQRSDPAGAWQTLGGLNGSVTCLAALGDGQIVAGGSFTQPGQYLAVWQQGAWHSLEMPALLPLALAASYSGILYVGGIDLGAGSSVLRWDGSDWSAVGNGTGGTVHALLLDADGRLYAGGNFAGGVACWLAGAWRVLGAGVAQPDGRLPTVYALATDSSGTLCAGGDFGLAGGTYAPHIAWWTGGTWVSPADGLGGIVRTLAVHPGDGSLLVGGAFSTAAGRSLPAPLARWQGQVWLPVPLALDTPADLLAAAYLPDGSLLIGYNRRTTARAGALTSVPYTGTAPAFPVLMLTGVGRVEQLIHMGTGATITFVALDLYADEVLTLDLRPATRGLSSSLRGSLPGAVLPGSALASWHLLPGDNPILLLAAQATATLTWQDRYWSNADVAL